MDPPVPKKRQGLLQTPVPAPRRHLPPVSLISDVPTSSNSDNRSSIVDSALLAKDKISKGMLLGARLAKQVVEQGIPIKKLNIRPPSKIVVTNPLEEVTPSDLDVFDRIQFHSPIIRNQDNDNNAIYSRVAKSSPRKDNSMFYDTPSRHHSSQFNDAFESTSIYNNFSNVDGVDSPNASSHDLTFTNDNSKVLTLSNQYENFHLNIPQSNYETLQDCKTFIPKADKHLHVDDPNHSTFTISQHEAEYENAANSNRNTPTSLIMNPSQPGSSDDNANFNSNLPSKSYNDAKKYENFIPIRNTNNNRYKKADVTKSTILEFDPILKYDIAKTDNSKTNEMLLMDLILLDFCNDHEENVDDTLSEVSDCDFFGENSDIYMSPPTPPERNDSLNLNNIDFKEELFKNAMNESSTKPVWFVDEDPDSAPATNQSIDLKSPKSNVFMKRFSNMLKIVPETATQIKKRFDVNPERLGKIEKPPMSKANIIHQGNMMRSLSAPMEELFKNYQMRFCVLKNQILYYYSDSNSTSLKETYNLKNFYSIQIIKILSANCHHFQINYYNPSIYSSRNTVTFGCNTPTERSEWMMKIVQVATTVFPKHLISNYTRFGWCYLKGNISQQWESGWILLSRRFIYYHTSHDTTIHDLDLRKAKSVVLQKDESGDGQNEDRPVLILDFQNRTLYLKMGCSAETKMWKRIIKSISINNGRCLHQQQLTKDDIPVIVQKCINFICCYGSLSEGIYRRSGRMSAVTALLELFNKDAWAHHLSDKDYCEHDIAAVMKAFFRNLPEPLIPVDFQAPLCRVSDFTDDKKKVESYQKIFSKLQVINKSTLKVLIGHLNFISSFSDENLMNVENLASIWTPTLMPSCNSNAFNLQQATQVIKDLIHLYVRIYNPSDSEIERENSILNVLRKYKEISTPIPVKPSGQFHVWIRIDNGKEDIVNVSVGPTQTCGDVCSELSPKMNIEAHMLCLKEVVCEEKLWRPIHYSEIVLDIVFNWGNWDQCDRKENSLVLVKNTFFVEMSNIQKKMVLPFQLKKEFKYADDKTKTFRTCLFNMSESSLTCYKPKNNDILLEEWNMNDVRWYVGHESKRNPSSAWSMTLLKNNKSSRSKGRPWFGHIIGGQHEDDMKLLLAYFLHLKHPYDLIPEVPLIVT